MTETGTAAERRDLITLHEAALAVGSTTDLRQALYGVLEILARRMDMRRGTVTLLAPDEDGVQVEVAHGLSAEAVRLGRYKLGEGITGRVVEQGRPMIVPHINQEPRFLHRTQARNHEQLEDVSFLCVPIKSGTKVIGALSVDRVFTS